jgi:hypothetical protein
MPTSIFFLKNNAFLGANDYFNISQRIRYLNLTTGLS